MSQFIESIRIQHQQPHLLDLHQQRVNSTLEHFNAVTSLNLEQIVRNLNWDTNGLFKLRIIYDLEGNYETQITPYIFNKIESFKTVEDNVIDYEFKYENRSEFDTLKKENAPSEIVIVKNGMVTDTSFSNLVFLKDTIWYTPKTYLLNGIQRQYLLKEKLIQEIEIDESSLQNFSHFRLINAMNPLDQAFTYPIEKLLKSQPSDEFYL